MYGEQFRWVASEPTLVTIVGEDLYLVQRLLVATSQADPNTAVVVGVRDGDVLLNGIISDLGEDAMAYLSLIDEADAMVAVGETYLSDPTAHQG